MQKKGKIIVLREIRNIWITYYTIDNRKSVASNRSIKTFKSHTSLSRTLSISSKSHVTKLYNTTPSTSITSNMPTLPSIGSFDSFQRQQNNNEEKSSSNRDSKFKGVLDKFVGM